MHTPLPLSPLSLPKPPHRPLGGPMSLSQALFSPGGIQKLRAAVAASMSALPEPAQSPEPPALAGHSPTDAQGSCHSTPLSLLAGLPVQVPSLPDSASELPVRTGLLISSQGWGGQLHPQMFMVVFFPIISKEALNSLRFCYCQHQKIV